MHPPGSIPKVKSDVSGISDSESDDNTRKSGKQRHCDGRSDDDLSLHTSDDLDDAGNIQMLTEHSKATGQKAQESPAKETEHLQDFANNCEMLKKQAKSAIPLQPHLRMGPLEGDSATHTKMTATRKAPKKVFCGKADSGLRKRKNHQTATRNNGTAASNKIHGKWVYKFSTLLIELFTKFMCHFFDKVLLSNVLGACIECTATPAQ